MFVEDYVGEVYNFVGILLLIFHECLDDTFGHLRMSRYSVVRV